MNRYRDIECTEDLGLDYPPADRTDDLVGAQKNDPAPVAAGNEVEVQQLPNKGMRTTT